MRYYPANRVKTNLKATGNEFTLKGTPYTGDYYETYDGKFYTGKSPIDGPSQELTPYIEPEVIPTQKNLAGSTGRTLSTTNPYEQPAPTLKLSDRQAELTTFKTPQPYYPSPTQEDYDQRAFMRYFAKKRDQPGYIFEINKATHDSLKQVDSEYDYITYESISTLWQLVGPLYDDRTNRQYKIAGIIDTNKRLIEAKEAAFTGLTAYIGGDYTKFARPSTN